MKKCSKCQQSKSESEFYGDRSRTRGLSRFCKPCTADHLCEKRHARGLKKCGRKRKVIKANELKKDLILLHKQGGCRICGYNKLQDALEFHHLDPEGKEFGISCSAVPIDRLRLELEKCIVVCANCHREVHAGLVNLSELGYDVLAELTGEKKNTPQMKLFEYH